MLSGGKISAANRRVTIENLWQSFSKTAMLKLSKNKQTHYRTARKKLEEIAYIDIRLLTIDDLQDIVDKMAPTHYPAKDIKTLLTHLYTRAEAEQIVRANLAAFIVLPSLNETPTQPFTCEEVLTLWKGWEQGDLLCGLSLLMIYTGMMPGELRQLRCEMIDWNKQTIVGCGLKTKVRKENPIIVPDIVIPVLRKLCDLSKGNIISPYPYDIFCVEFKNMVKRYKLNEALRPYSCRHTTGTTLAEADTPLLAIKSIMRHSRSTTTQRYIHLDSAPLIDAANTAYSTDKE